MSVSVRLHSTKVGVLLNQKQSHKPFIPSLCKLFRQVSILVALITYMNHKVTLYCLVSKVPTTKGNSKMQTAQVGKSLSFQDVFSTRY